MRRGRFERELRGRAAWALLAAILGMGIGGGAAQAGTAPTSPAPAPVAQLPGQVPGQFPEEAARPELKVYLWTMDQGDVVYEMFGHNALVLEIEETGEAYAWNWGLFDFEDVDFIPRFLRGTMLYTMGPAYPHDFLDYYRRYNRSVYSNEILLTQTEAWELFTFIRWNYLPDNRDYLYDYFRDNCSTRVRDAIDMVLGGILAPDFRAQRTERSYRWHTRRLVQGTTWVDLGLSFLLGTRGDEPITAWDEMFLPMELLRHLEEVEFQVEDGDPMPLLGPREVLFDADRDPLPDEPPSFSFLWLLVGLGGGGLVGLAGHRSAEGSTGARIGLGVIGGGWALFSGLLGAILVSAWFTDHVFIQWNVNLLYASPLALLLLPFLIGALAWERWALGRVGSVARGLALVVAVGSILAALVQLVGLVRQGNAEVIAIALPMNVALAWALLQIGRRPAHLPWIPGP